MLVQDEPFCAKKKGVVQQKTFVKLKTNKKTNKIYALCLEEWAYDAINQ